MTGDEIIALARSTHLRMGGAGAVDPIPVARAKGVYFWTPEGKRFIDFNSQLMCVNIGHGDPRVVKAIQDQAEVLTYVTPAMATEPRARWVRSSPRSRRAISTSSSLTNGGAEANENAFKIARARWAARRSSLDTARITAAPRLRLPPRASREAGARHRCRASSMCSTRITGSSADGNRQTARFAISRGDPARRAHTIAAFILESVTEPTGSSFHPTATCRACERCATNTASS